MSCKNRYYFPPAYCWAGFISPSGAYLIRYMAAKELTSEQVMQGLKAKDFKPVYLLMGEEDYYIDQIASYMEQHILTEEEKEFNQTVLYGSDVEVGSIIMAARRYPMMAERQVIIVKEAQNVKNLEELATYLQKPMPTTILVICYKHGTVDKRKKFATEVGKQGVLFEAKKMRDTALPGFITTYLRGKSLGIDDASTHLLAEYVGNDLSRLVGELEKLTISLPQGERRITPELIEKNIGISKEYNIFELRKALVHRDMMKAYQIVDYFSKNSKQNPIQMNLSVLFGFFSNLMLAYYAPQRSPEGISAQLDLRTPWQAEEYITAMRNYSGMKVMQIIGEIRNCDARSKGFGVGTAMPDGELLRELIYFILH